MNHHSLAYSFVLAVKPSIIFTILARERPIQGLKPMSDVLMLAWKNQSIPIPVVCGKLKLGSDSVLK